MIFIRSELSNRIKFWVFKAEFSSIFRKSINCLGKPWFSRISPWADFFVGKYGILVWN